MAFFDDARRFGILVMVTAIISLAAGIGALTEGLDETWNLLDGIGGIVAALIMLGCGLCIFLDMEPGFLWDFFPEGAGSKFGAITGFTAAAGLALLIGLGPELISAILGAVIGVLLLAIAWMITDEKKGLRKKIVWVSLAVLFFLCLMHGVVIALGTGLSILTGVAEILTFLVAMFLLYDGDVKAKFGL